MNDFYLVRVAGESWVRLAYDDGQTVTDAETGEQLVNFSEDCGRPYMPDEHEAEAYQDTIDSILEMRRI